MKEPSKYRPDCIKDPAGRAPGESHHDMLMRHAEQKVNRRIRHHERRAVRSCPPCCLV